MDATARILDALIATHERFVEHGIWHCLTYGTLLGAVRDGDLIPWDYDFDLMIRPCDVGRVLALTRASAARGIAFQPVQVPAGALAVNPLGLGPAWGGAVGVFADGDKIADLYAFTLFDDGVLRRFDVEQDVYWVPHSSVPHFFFERLESAAIRGRTFPIPQHAEVFLAGVYGEDWRTPYRAVRQGGAPRDGATDYGDRYEPKLAAEIAWCEAHGWNRSKYATSAAGRGRFARPDRSARRRAPRTRRAPSGGARAVSC